MKWKGGTQVSWVSDCHDDDDGGEPEITNSLVPLLPAPPCRDKSYRHILGKLAVEHWTRSSKKNCDPNYCVYQNPAIHEASSDCLKRLNQS